MEAAYLVSSEDALRHFQVTEQNGLSDVLVQRAIEKYGRNGTILLNTLSLCIHTKTTFLQPYQKILRRRYGS